MQEGEASRGSQAVGPLEKATFPIPSPHPVMNLIVGNVRILRITFHGPRFPGRSTMQSFPLLPRSQRAVRPDPKRLSEAQADLGPPPVQTFCRAPSPSLPPRPAPLCPPPSYSTLLPQGPPHRPFLSHNHVEIHISKNKFYFLSPFLRTTQN